MQGYGTSPGALGRLLASQEAERRRLAAEAQAQARRRILDAAQVDPDTLSEQGRRTLAWLADWDKPTIDGLVELLAAARIGAVAEQHRAESDRRRKPAVEGSARLDAALARSDARLRDRRLRPEGDEPGVEL